MSIVDLREVTLPIASLIANAYTDFSKMTCSLVAVLTSLDLSPTTTPLYALDRANGLRDFKPPDQQELANWKRQRLALLVPKC